MNGTVGIKEGERSTWENVKRMSYSSSSWSSTSNYGDDSISSTQPRYGSESNEDDSAEEIAEAGESNERYDGDGAHRSGRGYFESELNVRTVQEYTQRGEHGGMFFIVVFVFVF